MHINEALLIAYQDAGATSSNLVEAEYQALVANGAADGKWHTFLRADGWTGSLDEMMYAYLGDKGYAGTISERLYQAAVALDLFASSLNNASLNYATLFTTLGATGVVMDTVAFPPLLSSGGAEAGNGDPVGYVPDAANSGYAFEQTTSGAKLTCVVTNGIPAVKYGAGKEMPTTPSLSFAQNSVSTFIMVGRFAPNEQVAFGFWGSIPTFGYLYDVFTHVYLYAAGDRRGTAGGLTQNTPVIVRFRVTSFPAVYIDSYLMDGTQLNNANSWLPLPIDYNAPFQIGYSSLSPQSEIAFLLAADKLVDGDNWTAVQADLVSRYGGW